MKKLLIVVDLENDFVSGALAADGASEAVENAKALIAQAQKEGTEVVYTRDVHDEDYLSTQEGRLLPVPHCMKNTQGAELVEGVYLAGAKIFDKGAFASMELARFVAGGGFDEVTLCGICTDICVVSNALLIKAFCPELTLRVVAPACAGTSVSNHEAALSTMAACQIEIINALPLNVA